MTPPRSYTDQRPLLDRGELTATALVEYYLAQATQHAGLNAFLELFAQEARTRAAALDAKPAHARGRLFGLVLAIKDNIVYRGHRAGASSKILTGFESVFTATALERLLAEDCIVLGRTNCDEFAMGSSNENSAYGPVHNPHDPTRVSGGSSGGSTAAVAAGLCCAALGSDTGGSVRQPAAFCGVVGLKPSYGRVSRWGLIAYGSSFDQIGPLTASVDDAALLLEVMAGPDPNDQTTAPTPYRPSATDGPKRIGILREALESPGLQPEIKAALEQTRDRLVAEGHRVELVDFPLLEVMVGVYYILTTAEASSNLARFDGIRYGYRAEGELDLETLYARSRSEGFGPEVKRRILLGTFVLSAGYYDAYYTQAMKVRRRIQEATRALFAQYDFLLSPTTPSTAFRIGEKATDPIALYLADIFTVHANLAGIPGLSLPAGTDGQGLPIGLQLMADYLNDAELLAFARRLAPTLASLTAHPA
ncbi:MAG: Asp-tRNA(Asn)/Glu-tRNA(Gln) amidotransferase subunit GatA [Bacteroidia bacterium]|nr:Asp-tRNA(Asn)/Glu-tRNA(Gln) amidotransferase subunit GatA [Bacteroidia bacterium]